MTSNPITSIISRSNRNKLVLGTVGVVLLLALAGLSWRYFYNFFLGPFPMSREELLATTDPGAPLKYFVTISGEQAFNVGEEVQRSRRSGTERTTATFMALLVDDHFLLIKSPSSAEVTDYTGALTRIPSNVQREVIDGVVRDEPRLDGMFLPFMLDATNFRTIGYVGLALGLLVLVFCLVQLVQALQRGSDPLKHPLMRALGRFGPPQQVASEIEGELFAPHEQLGNLHLTPRWMVQSASATLEATRLEDILWVYKQVTQRRVNGIPAGKTYAAHVFDRHGTKIIMPGKNEADTDQTLRAVMSRVPWALGGYSGEIEKAWKTNRASLIAAVDQRRQQIYSASAGAATQS